MNEPKGRTGWRFELFDARNVNDTSFANQCCLDFQCAALRPEVMGFPERTSPIVEIGGGVVDHQGAQGKKLTEQANKSLLTDDASLRGLREERLPPFERLRHRSGRRVGIFDRCDQLPTELGEYRVQLGGKTHDRQIMRPCMPQAD
jgi:hypothetical protein